MPGGQGKIKHTSFRVPEQIKVPAQKQAAADGVDLTNVVNQLLDMYGRGVITIQKAAS